MYAIGLKEACGDIKMKKVVASVLPMQARYFSNRGKKEILPVAAIVVAVLLWGGSFSAMRIAVSVLHPMSVMWIRMMIAFVVILPFVKKLKPENYQKGDWKLLLPMVLFQPCLYFLLESNALQYTTSSQAGVISACVPLLVTIGAGIVLSEPITGKATAGLFLSISGVAALTLLEKEGGIAVNPLFGNSLEFCAMCCAAVNMIIVKQLCERYNPWTLTAMQVFSGIWFFSPGVVFLFRDEAVAITFGLVTALVFLGALVSLGAFGLYNWGLSYIPASRAAHFVNLVPVTAVIIGWTFMGEALGMMQCFAAAAVVLGVWISQTGKIGIQA